jgi:Sulfotransferase family
LPTEDNANIARQMPAPKLPNFFVVGAPKAGTTSLYAYLNQHPQVYMCPIKEPSYFAFELRYEKFGEADRIRLAPDMLALQEYLRGEMQERRFSGLVSSWEDYLRLFRNAKDEIAIGEATPSYLWSETAVCNIAALIPHAKIIIQLRNPVERAYSQYLHMVAVGRTRRSFREHIDESFHPGDRQLGWDWLLQFGRYHEQVSRYLSAFPRSQIRISCYEEFEGDPRRLMSELYGFLGVDPDFEVDTSERHLASQIPRFLGPAYFLKKLHLWPYLRSLVPAPLRAPLRSMLMRPRASTAIEPADWALLAEYYREDVTKLAALLDRDVTSWLEYR